MEPTLRDGDEVLVRRTQVAHIGDLVYLRHPFRSDLKLVKRLASTDGGLTVTCDGEGEDSSVLGVLPPDHLLGVVTSTIRPGRRPARPGR